VYLRNWPGMLLLLDPLCQFARNCAASALALSIGVLCLEH
jgi:hypothetical protein